MRQRHYEQNKTKQKPIQIPLMNPGAKIWNKILANWLYLLINQSIDLNTPWPSVVYPMDASVVSHLKSNQCNSPNYQAKRHRNRRHPECKGRNIIVFNCRQHAHLYRKVNDIYIRAY